eukprot:2228495-Prymnesium_polylepis.1
MVEEEERRRRVRPPREAVLQHVGHAQPDVAAVAVLTTAQHGVAVAVVELQRGPVCGGAPSL